MRSFKQWREINESLFPLGLSRPQNVSGIVGRLGQLDEKKKHMDIGDPEGEDEEKDIRDEEEGEDEEEGHERPNKGECGEEAEGPKFCKKMMKKKMKNECECEDKKGKKDVEMGHDEEEGGHEEADGDEGDEDVDNDGDGMKRPLGFMKKKNMKKKMKKESVSPKNDFLQSFNSYTAPGNQMSSEQQWWKSVANHFSNPDQKFGDGFTEYMEDYLIDPAAQQGFIQGNDQQSGTRPGEVGYAPQQRVGWLGNAVSQDEQ